MARSTKALSGPALARFFTDVVGTEPDLPAAPARRLTDQLTRSVSHARVRLPLRRRTEGPAASPTAPTEPAAAKFDPFAFSVVVVLSKEGRDALLARLSAIERMDDLMAVARAQHLGLTGPYETAEEIRLAILEGTERRIANRRAAAS